MSKLEKIFVNLSARTRNIKTFEHLFSQIDLSNVKKVLEVGCGPGFFTIPAAKIVGDEGVVYAIDIHPLAIKKVKEKVKKYRVTNVKPILANASNTKLPSQSIDLAFIFGLHYVAGGLENVISEMYRVLRTDGILAFEKTRGSEKEIIKLIEEKGFVYLEKRGRILIFTRRKMKV